MVMTVITNRRRLAIYDQVLLVYVIPCVLDLPSAPVLATSYTTTA